MTNDDFSLDDRILCSDGACIGVIGPDGSCKECGKTYEGSEALPQTDGPDSLLDEVPADSPDDVGQIVESRDVPADPSERECCSDEMCVGIIGEDGRCGTCGKTVEHS